MRLAVLTDIHGNLHALQAVLADLEAVGGADHIWVLGDLAAFGGHPAECVQLVRDIPDVKLVRGNTDRYLMTGERPNMGHMTEENFADMVAGTRIRDANFQWTLDRLSFADIKTFAESDTLLSLEVPDFGWVVAFHAVPGDDEGMALLPDNDDHTMRDALLDVEGNLAFCGHTHRAFDRDLGEWRVVNPGSVGFPFDGDTRAAYALATFEGNTLHIDLRRVDYDVEAAVQALQAGEHPAAELMIQRLRTAQH